MDIPRTNGHSDRTLPVSSPTWKLEMYDSSSSMSSNHLSFQENIQKMPTAREVFIKCDSARRLERAARHKPRKEQAFQVGMLVYYYLKSIGSAAGAAAAAAAACQHSFEKNCGWQLSVLRKNPREMVAHVASTEKKRIDEQTKEAKETKVCLWEVE